MEFGRWSSGDGDAPRCIAPTFHCFIKSVTLQDFIKSLIKVNFSQRYGRRAREGDEENQ